MMLRRSLRDAILTSAAVSQTERATTAVRDLAAGQTSRQSQQAELGTESLAVARGALVLTGTGD